MSWINYSTGLSDRPAPLEVRVEFLLKFNLARRLVDSNGLHQLGCEKYLYYILMCIVNVRTYDALLVKLFSRGEFYKIYKHRTCTPFDHNQAPTSSKTPPSPHRLFDLQDSLDKQMHFLPQR